MKEFIKNILPNNIIKFIIMVKNFFEKKVLNHEAYIYPTTGRHGIEIGGPSNIFKFKIPVYEKCSTMEFVNFSSQTVWEGKLSDKTKYFRNKLGLQHVYEATNLSFFADKQFDFCLSSNCLEHVANPIKAMMEMKRITKDIIILVLPCKDNNFDHRRQITSFDHLLDDFNSNVDENDLTHLEEILSLHDLKLDPPAGSFDQFKKRCLKNFENRCLHHHVFDDKLVKKICDYLNIKIIQKTLTKSDWIFLLSIKPSITIDL